MKHDRNSCSSLSSRSARVGLATSLGHSGGNGLVVLLAALLKVLQLLTQFVDIPPPVAPWCDDFRLHEPVVPPAVKRLPRDADRLCGDTGGNKIVSSHVATMPHKSTRWGLSVTKNYV